MNQSVWVFSIKLVSDFRTSYFWPGTYVYEFAQLHSCSIHVRPRTRLRARTYYTIVWLYKYTCTAAVCTHHVHVLEYRTLSLARGIRIFIIYGALPSLEARHPPGCPRTAVECRCRTHIHAAQEDRGRVW